MARQRRHPVSIGCLDRFNYAVSIFLEANAIGGFTIASFETDLFKL